MGIADKIIVEGIECRFVKVGDIIEPEDYNCKADILKILSDIANQIYSVVEYVGWG